MNARTRIRRDKLRRFLPRIMSRQVNQFHQARNNFRTYCDWCLELRNENDMYYAFEVARKIRQLEETTNPEAEAARFVAAVEAISQLTYRLNANSITIYMPTMRFGDGEIKVSLTLTDDNRHILRVGRYVVMWRGYRRHWPDDMRKANILYRQLHSPGIYSPEEMDQYHAANAAGDVVNIYNHYLTRVTRAIENYNETQIQPQSVG